MALSANIIKDARFTMLVSLLIAVILAIAHDGFYRSLHDRDVNGSINQRVSTSIGTAFAFLVKAACGIAIATAYSQLLWRVLLNKAHTVKTIDSLTGLLGSFLELRLHYPVLTAVALVFWTIPLAAVFPPGALSVVTALRVGAQNGTAHLINWHTPLLLAKNSTAVIQADTRTTPQVWYLSGTLSIAAASLASYTAGLGEIPTLHDNPNSTYSLSFVAPSLHCETHYWPVNYVLACPLNPGPTHQNPVNITVLSWYSQTLLPSYFGLGNSSFSANVSSLGQDHYYHITNKVCGDLVMYRYDYTGNTSMLYLATTHKDHPGWNITTCTPQNATYTVSANLTNESNQLTTTIRDEALQPIDQNFTEAVLNATGSDMQIWGPNDIHSSSAFQLFNRMTTFYAIFTYFGGLASGMVMYNVSESRPKIFDTRLVGAEEFQGTTDSLGDHGGLFGDPGYGHLAPMLEELFQNITVTMLTSPLLVDSIQVPMEYTYATNVYNYNSRHLDIPYAVAIFVTFVIASLGMVVIRRSRAVYTTKFSTYMRTLQTSPGNDPVPQAIQNTVVQLAVNSSEELVMYERPLLKDGS